MTTECVHTSKCTAPPQTLGQLTAACLSTTWASSSTPKTAAVCNNALYCVVTERVDPEEEEEEEEEAASRAASRIDLFTLYPAEPLYVCYVLSTDLLGNWMKLRHFGTQKRPLHMTNLHVVECFGSLFMVVGEWINYAASELEITIYVLLDSGRLLPAKVDNPLELIITVLVQIHRDCRMCVSRRGGSRVTSFGATRAWAKVRTSASWTSRASSSWRTM